MKGDQRVDRAREILALYDGHGTWSAASAASVAGHLADVVRQLLDVIAEARADTDAGKLMQVRAVLHHFNWEHDDRQYALEEIKRIVTGSAR